MCINATDVLCCWSTSIWFDSTVPLLGIFQILFSCCFLSFSSDVNFHFVTFSWNCVELAINQISATSFQPQQKMRRNIFRMKWNGNKFHLLIYMSVKRYPLTCLFNRKFEKKKIFVEKCLHHLIKTNPIDRMNRKRVLEN